MLSEIHHKIWVTLSTRSRRALRREKKGWGRKYFYEPRGTLLQRISKDFNCSLEQAREYLFEIREEQLNRVKID